MAVCDAPDELVDAATRLARLLDRPRDRPVLAPLIKKEILWRLITGDQDALVRHLQAVTAIRLLLATRTGDVTGVSARVGYESPSQFSREYRRQFGAPPSQDAASLRDATHAPPVGVLS